MSKDEGTRLSVGDFDRAVAWYRRDLMCPHCHAMNTPATDDRPAKEHIYVNQYGVAECSVCAHAFIPEMPR